MLKLERQRDKKDMRQIYNYGNDQERVAKRTYAKCSLKSLIYHMFSAGKEEFLEPTWYLWEIELLDKWTALEISIRNRSVKIKYGIITTEWACISYIDENELTH